MVRGVYSLITLPVNWIHTDVGFKSGQCNIAGKVEPPISKNKQLVDSQIGVSSISSRGGRYVFPYHADCILLATLETYKLCLNAGSSGCAHKFTVQKGDGGAWTTMPNKHKYYRSMSEQPIVDYMVWKMATPSNFVTHGMVVTVQNRQYGLKLFQPMMAQS